MFALLVKGSFKTVFKIIYTETLSLGRSRWFITFPCRLILLSNKQIGNIVRAKL